MAKTGVSEYSNYIALQNISGSGEATLQSSFAEAAGLIYFSGSASNLDRGQVKFGGSAGSTTVSASMFIGDGSQLTGVNPEIDSLAANPSDFADPLSQTTASLLVSDNGTEQKITFGKLAESVYAEMNAASSDVSLSAAGAIALANNSVGTVEIADNAVTTAKIADNDVTVAKLADLSRGSIIYGNSSAASAELTKGAANTVLSSDGTDISYTQVSNAMLAGSIANAKLVNDSVTVGSTVINLGATASIIAGLSQLTASAITVDYLRVKEYLDSVTVTENSLEILDKQIACALSASGADLNSAGLLIGGTAASPAAELTLVSNGAMMAASIGGQGVWTAMSGALNVQGGLNISNDNTNSLPFMSFGRDQGVGAYSMGASMGLTTGGVFFLGNKTSVNGALAAPAFTVASGSSVLAVPSIDVAGGEIDATVIGGNTAAAGTFTALVGTSLSLTDGNLTNVGDISCDTVKSDAAGVGLEIDFDGNTTLNKITLTDNLADALNINEGGNSYMKFVTTNSSEQIVFGKDVTFAAAGVSNLGTVTTADIDGGTIDNVIIGGTTAAGGQFTGLACTSLDVGDGNISNVGTIAADAIGSDAGATGLAINFDGNTGTNKIVLSDNLASALDVTEASNSYLKFVTTNGSEGIEVSKPVDFAMNVLLADDVVLGLGDNDEATLKYDEASTDKLLVKCANGILFDDSAVDFGASGDTGNGDVQFFGHVANDRLIWDSSANKLELYDGGTKRLSIGSTLTTDYAVDVESGTANINKIRASAFVTYSRRDLKEEITPLNGALESVMKMQGVTYNLKSANGARSFVPSDKQEVGFIAEDMAKVVPQVVQRGDLDGDVHGIDYAKLTAVLAEAIKEQQAQIEMLQAKINKVS